MAKSRLTNQTWLDYIICTFTFKSKCHIFIMIFFNTASSVCQSLRVELKHNALEAQRNKEGTYSLSSLVNGQPSWTSESCGCGIWYVEGIDRWLIGSLESIGEENGEIHSDPKRTKQTEYPFNIMNWKYYTEEDGWMPSNGKDEIIIECIGEEDRQRKGKLLVGLIDMPNHHEGNSHKDSNCGNRINLFTYYGK